MFHAMLNHKHIPVTAIGYCPFIPNSPTHPAVVAEAVEICMKTSKKLGMTHTVITHDESIYEIIYTLRKNAPDEYENLILRLGGFHFLTNYLGAVGKFYVWFRFERTVCLRHCT